VIPRAYYWRGDERTGAVANLGDQLTPLLLKHFAGLDVQWAPPAEADIVCCGSVLDVLPRSGWRGTVIGAGQLHRGTVTDLRDANVLAVRGMLTRERVQCAGTPVVGDPGLLASELVTPVPNSIELGVLPHWSDHELWLFEQANALKYKYAVPTLIDITGDPLDVIRQIGSCRKVVTSSLHGVVVADAFGIPRRAELAPSMMTNAAWEGGRFKWSDYGSSLGQRVEFGTLQTAPKVRVDQMQHDLFEAFITLRENAGVLHVA
jgi:hypothetical protein